MDIENEYEQFLDDVNSGLSKMNYLDVELLEDDYSHNEIFEAHDELIYKIKEWLHKNMPGEWVVWTNYTTAVYVMKKAVVKNEELIKQYLVK